MDVLFKWVDQITSILPSSVLTGVRVGALALWLILAVFMAANSWQEGEEAAYQSGDRKQSTKLIQEQVARERNLRRAPHIFLPELEDLPKEASPRESLSARENSQERYPEREDDSQFYVNERETLPYPAYLGESSRRPAYSAEQNLQNRRGANLYRSSLSEELGKKPPLPNSQKIQSYRNAEKSFPLPLSKDASSSQKRRQSASEDMRGSLQKDSTLIEDVSTLPLPAKK